MKRHKLPPVWLLVPAALLLAAVAWLQLTDATGDTGMNNALSYMTLLLLGVLLLGWFVVLSAYGIGLRLGALAVIMVASVVGYQLFEVSWTGNMVPQLSLGSGSDGPDPVEPIADLEVTADAALDLAAVQTPQDFPGYFGPARDGRAPAARLGRDWATTAPEELWRVPVGSGWSGFAVVGDVCITMEQRGEQQLVVARDANSGELIWSHAWAGFYDHALGGAGPRCTPAVDTAVPGGRVYAQDPLGQVVCLAGDTGELLWSFDLPGHLGSTPENEVETIGYGRSGSPLLVGGDLVVLPGGGPAGAPRAGLVALDRTSGEVVWEGPPFQISHASPSLVTLAGRQQILVVNEDTLSGHDPEDGALLWQHPFWGVTAAQANNSQPLVVGEDRVLVSKGYGQGGELFRVLPGEEGWTTETVWASKRSLRTKLTSPVVRGDHAYGLSDGILECVSLENGRRVWKKGRYGHGQLLLAEDVLVVLGEQGEVSLVEATPEGKGATLGQLEVLEGKTWNTLALGGDRLLVRNATEAVGVRLPVVTD